MDVSINGALDLHETVGAAALGDTAAFEALYRRYAPGLVPVLWRLAAGDEARAEDWLQDAFVQAWGSLGKLRDPGAFPAWLKRLAINVALSDRRRAGFRVVKAAQEAAGPEPPWPGADLDLERAIARLPERARQVLVLFCLCELSHAEIGELMTIETGTSKAQLSRARSMLKEMLA